jgi:hypothetical protein
MDQDKKQSINLLQWGRKVVPLLETVVAQRGRRGRLGVLTVWKG